MKSKIDNIFSWFNSLSTFIKVISSIIVLGATIANGIGIYNNWIIKKHDSTVQIDVKQINDKLELLTSDASQKSNALKALNDNQVVISGQVEDVKTKVNDISDRFDVMNRKLDTETKAIGNHLEKENMLQDKINFLQELIDDEKKNKNLNLSSLL